MTPSVLAKFQPGQPPSARLDLVRRVHRAASRFPHRRTGTARHRPLPAPPSSAWDGADERQQECPPRSPAAPRTPAVPAPPALRRGRDPARAQRRGDSDHLTITTTRVIADSHACPARRDVSSHHRRFQSGNAWEDAPEFSGGARRRLSPQPTAAGGCSASLSLSGALS